MSDDSDNGETTVDLRGLDKLLRALKAPPPTARVGILGGAGSAPHGTSGVSNATIGAAHEFGTSTLPVRSFLRLPLTAMLDKRIEGSGLADPAHLAAVLATATVTPWVREIAVLAEGIVADAFDTGGFGTWPGNAPGTKARKKNDQVLVETQQLRNSITSEVK